MVSDGELFEECPLCLEEIDILDSNFKPCPCGYQICMFCYEKICSGDNRCPACRRAYTEEGIQNDPVTPKQIAKAKAKKSTKEGHADAEHSDRKILPNSRVEQKNLVYVLGFSNKYCNPELLRKNEYFGQFGTITKLIISPRNKVGSQSSFAVYVTYSNSDEATRAIYALDGCEVDGKLLKACYGTTKYCANFLKHVPCTNPTCLYLHEITRDSDYAVSTSNRFALKSSAPPFPTQSSGVKRSERRGNVVKGFSVSGKDLRALPATASWAKGPASGLDTGARASGNAAMDFPALLPVRTESNRPVKTSRRKDRKESPREPIVPNLRSVSPTPAIDPFDDLNTQTGSATPDTKTTGDIATLNMPDPLSEDDLVYSSEEEVEKEDTPEPEASSSDIENFSWPVSSLAQASSPVFSMVSAEETFVTPQEEASPSLPEMVQVNPITIMQTQEDHNDELQFPLSGNKGVAPRSPRLEFGRVPNNDDGFSRFVFAQPRRMLTPPVHTPIHTIEPTRSWDADIYVEGLLNSPELPHSDYGSNISLQDLFQAAATAYPPPHLPQQQLPPKQKQASRFFKTKPQPEPQFPIKYYPGQDLENERAHFPVSAFSALRPPFQAFPPPHYYEPRPAFFPVPVEPSHFRPPPFGLTSDVQDSVKPLVADFPKENMVHRPPPPGLGFQQLSPPQHVLLNRPAPQPVSPEIPEVVPEIIPEVINIPEEVQVVEEPASPQREASPVAEISRPPTPPMPKLAFDHIPAFRSSLDKRLSDRHRDVIQKELSSVYSLLLAAIENNPTPTAPPVDQDIMLLEAKVAQLKAKPLLDFPAVSAQRTLMKEAQQAFKEATALSNHLQTLSASFNYLFDMNFEL